MFISLKVNFLFELLRYEYILLLLLNIAVSSPFDRINWSMQCRIFTFLYSSELPIYSSLPGTVFLSSLRYQLQYGYGLLITEFRMLTVVLCVLSSRWQLSPPAASSQQLPSRRLPARTRTQPMVPPATLATARVASFPTYLDCSATRTKTLLWEGRSRSPPLSYTSRVLKTSLCPLNPISLRPLKTLSLRHAR